MLKHFCEVSRVSHNPRHQNYICIDVDHILNLVSFVDQVEEDQSAFDYKRSLKISKLDY